MRKTLLGCVIISGLAGIPAFAAAPEDPMHAAISHEFEGYKVEPTETKEINGIKVSWFTVSDKNASALAAVTEGGDFLIAGEPHDPHKLPGPVGTLVTRLFGTPPSDVDRYVVTTYAVTVESNGKHDGLVFDAVGRLKDLHADSDEPEAPGVAPEDVINKDAEATLRMQSMADRFYGKGSKVDHIFRDPDVEHFYHVSITTRDGQSVSVVTNGNDVYSRRERISEKRVPPAVMAAVNDLFKGAKFVAAYRRTYEYYQFNVQTSGGDTVTLHIGTNGQILDVQSAQAAEDMQKVKAGSQHPK